MAMTPTLSPFFLATLPLFLKRPGNRVSSLELKNTTYLTASFSSFSFCECEWRNLGAQSEQARLRELHCCPRGALA